MNAAHLRPPWRGSTGASRWKPGPRTRRRGRGLVPQAIPRSSIASTSTTNTIGLLLVIAEMGLLRYHEIDVPESRGGIASLPHTTAVVRERENGQKWAVDAWTHNNGEYPDILKLEMWKERS